MNLSWYDGAVPRDYKTRYACFPCRKAFKAVDRYRSIRCCPQCAGKLSGMSMWWKVPKQTDKKGWEKSKEFIRT